MAQGLGYGKIKLVNRIVKNIFDEKYPQNKTFNYNEMLYVIQELFTEEGKAYADSQSVNRGHSVFRFFVEHLLYRNIANYDSMVLITSEKGCLTDDTLITISEDNIIKQKTIKELLNKGSIKVLSYNIKNKNFEVKISDGVEYAKTADTYKVEFEDGTIIKSTLDHPFLLYNNTYKQLKDLLFGDKIVNKSGVLNSFVKKTFYKKLDVYDVVNVRDNHNFIANGFVVSNTGKSSAAMMMGRQWCKLIGIRFDPGRHMAYNNADVMHKIDVLKPFECIICDEAIRFASSADWAKAENKSLKKKLAQVRTKHLLYILCFPLKIQKVEKTYLESFTNYWLDLYDRGVGAIYVKDKNPSLDSWRIKDFKNVGSYTEFTSPAQIREKLKKHPNFWQIIKFPKPPEWLYSRYLKVREKNVYDEDSVISAVSKEDINNALLILALRDIMQNDVNLTMNRVILHVKNEYDIPITKGMVESSVKDAKQLVTKIREGIVNG
jgi:hypothetical protein